jgi:hypothetical protein
MRRLRKVFTSHFNSSRQFGFTLAAIPELTREVSLPDQSGRIVGAAQKVSKCNLAETLWKYVQTCARNPCRKSSKNLFREICDSSGLQPSRNLRRQKIVAAVLEK